jgi:signal transduction histidine kinase
MRRLPVPVIDLALALACAAVSFGELFADDVWAPGPRVPQVLAVGIACSALAIRRRAALPAAVIFSLALLGMAAATEPPQLFGLGLVGMIVAFTIAAELEGRTRAGAAMLFVVATVVRDLDDPQMDVDGLLVDLLIFGLAAAAGLIVQRRQRQVEHVARVSDDRAQDAIRDERARIARELHDVIAHGMSVMVVQADAARHGVAADDEVTRASLSAIERTGRESLREMRRLLGLLQENHTGSASLSPQPGVGDLGELARSLLGAGLRVEIRVEGEPVPLTPGTDLAAYRIVQEALTNVLRHAGPARATVRVGYTHRDLELEIADTGRGNGTNGGSGRGLVGMAERARLYGGTLEAGPGHNGFVVRALLPLEPQAQP